MIRVTEIAGQNAASKRTYYHKTEARQPTSSTFPREVVARWQLFSPEGLENKELDAARFTALREVVRSRMQARPLSELPTGIAEGFNDIFPYLTVEVEFRSDILNHTPSRPTHRRFPSLFQNGRSKFFSDVLRSAASVEDVNKAMMGIPLTDEGDNVLGLLVLSKSQLYAQFPERVGIFAEELGSQAAGRLEKAVMQERNHQLNEEISELSTQNRRLKRQVGKDSFTGLRNKRNFREELDKAIAIGSRHIRPLSMLILDIDHFKNINDTYGHPVGDKVIKKIANIMKRYCKRKGDIAARFGGEEFTALLPDTNHEGALMVAEEIRKAVEKEIKIKGKPVTVSVGVSAAFDPGLGLPKLINTSDGLIESADRALYAAKRTGRNKVEAGS